MPRSFQRSVVPVVIAVAAGIYFILSRNEDQQASPPDVVAGTASDDAAIVQAFEQHASDVWVESQGEVTRLLPDDTEGSRHQRFILRLSSGHTVLVSHNIDLAPRVDALGEGDRVAFRGEYEWNDRGGVVHWTHHDPQGRTAGGWLEHAGRRYE